MTGAPGRKRRAAAVVLGALALAAGPLPAPAQEGPPTAALRDARVIYRLAAPDERIGMAFRAGGGLIRADGSDDRWATILDRARGVVVFLMPPTRDWTEVPMQTTGDVFTLSAAAGFTRGGEETVAGLPCTDWTARFAEGEALACVSPDGLVLRAASGHAGGGAMEAVSVSFDPLPDSLFAPPPGWTRVDTPEPPDQAPSPAEPRL